MSALLRKPRRFSHYRIIDRTDPRNKYLRRRGRRYQVRIPLDGSGEKRLTLGWYSEEEARFVRSRILSSLGVQTYLRHQTGKFRNSFCNILDASANIP